MKQNKRFKQDFIINKDYTPNQNLSKNYDNLNETNHQDFVSKKTNKLKFARGKSESTFEFRAPQAKNSYSGFKQKNHTHRFTKIFAGVSLATLITCGTVLGFAPLASSGMSSNSSTSSSMSATAGVENTESLKTHVAEYKADIESGKIKYAPSALGLDPANDPVLFTTESGLEIKMSNANPTVNHNGSFANSALNGYMYLTMGTYNGYAINWLITAFSNKLLDTTTPAGALLNTLTSKNQFLTTSTAGTNGLYCDTTLPAGNFRVVSECVMGTCKGMETSNSQGTGFSIYAYSDYNNDLYARNTRDYTLSNYKTNDSLNLSNFLTNGTITTDLYYLSATQANSLLSRITYEIGTTTPTTWWNNSNYSSAKTSTSGSTDYYTIYMQYYAVDGVLTTGTAGTYSKYNWDDGDDTYYAGGSSLICGIRPGLVVKLL